MQVSKAVAVICLATAGLILLANSGCAPRYTTYDVSYVEPGFLEPLQLHALQVKGEVSAQLVQVTVRSSRMNKRFNMEMYHRSDTSWFYYGGFLGKGSFKGMIADSTVMLLMPSDKAYYSGYISGLAEPDMSRYEPIVSRFRDALAGQLICETDDPGCDAWDQFFSVGKKHIGKAKYVHHRIPDISIEIELGSFRDEFPRYRFKKAYVRNVDSGGTIKFKFIEERFGEVPEVKFSIPDTTGWTRIDYFDLN